MGLDILLFRDEKGLELVTTSQKARYDNPEEIQAIVDTDNAWRSGRCSLHPLVFSLSVSHPLSVSLSLSVLSLPSMYCVCLC
jgi:hypothetical protein